MKKILVIAALVLVCHSISYAQVDEFETFLDGFSPENSYYVGHHGNPTSHHQLNTLYWNKWFSYYDPILGYTEHYNRNIRYDFSYLPNGDIHQVEEYMRNGSTWRFNYRYAYEYDEQGRMTSYRIGGITDGHWKSYVIYDFTYDDFDRVTVKYITIWNGDGYADSHSEYHYCYDDEGHLISKSLYYSDLGFYYKRWLYNYNEGKLDNRCFQLYNNNTGWTNIDLYLYSYNENGISEMLHQKWNFSSEIWQNDENTIYEYENSGATSYTTLQTWSNEWVNQSRTIKEQNENGVLLHELYQEWQDEKWIDKQDCEYSLDDSGNSTEGLWKDYVDGEWVDSQDNHNFIISFNDGESLLSGAAQSYQAVYSYFVGIDELSSSLQAEAFPNPGTDQLTIQTEIPFTDVLVYDLMGRQMFSENISKTSIRINTESWPSGIYFWKAYNSSSAQCGKWVKN